MLCKGILLLSIIIYSYLVYQCRRVEPVCSPNEIQMHTVKGRHAGLPLQLFHSLSLRAKTLPLSQRGSTRKGGRRWENIARSFFQSPSATLSLVPLWERGTVYNTRVGVGIL